MKTDDIKRRLPVNVKLIAVTKKRNSEEILKVYNAGVKIFGESQVQELLPKYQQLPKDIQWHFIGHLQTNKVKYIAPFITLIHSVDSIKLLKTINKEAEKCNRTIDVLLQLHIAEEQTKYGFKIQEINNIITNNNLEKLQNIRIVGVMGMATNTNNSEQVKNEFKTLKETFLQLKKNLFQNNAHFTEISMGMSRDYKIALQEGSTMVRIGTVLFN